MYNTEKIEVQMSKKLDFDDCLEVIQTKEVETKTALDEFLGDDVNADDWREHWKEMPEFEQENKAPFKRLNVCFETEEDFINFRKLLGQSMTLKTKTIWYPPLDREANSLYSWFEDDSEV
jgi:hypothetical protein